MNYNTIVWILFIAISLPLAYKAIKKYMRISKLKKEAMLKLEDKKEYYHVLTKEKIEACPREDLSTAVVSNILRIESEDYDHVYDNLNEYEKVVYVIYESLLSIDNGKGNIRAFFESDYLEDFFDMIGDAYDAIDCNQIGDMMRACYHLHYIIENDIDNEEEEAKLGDYSNYNFSDYTNEFMTLVMTLNVNEKLTDYIDSHRLNFISKEEDNDENVSE